MKKDNLEQYRLNKVEKNLKFVKKAIEHLKKFNIEVTLSNVSKTTYDLSSDTQKGLSISALCKNKIYKELIDKEKNNGYLPKEQSKNSFSSKTLREMSEPELIAEIYKLKADNLQKDTEITTLKDLLSEYEIDPSNKIVENINNDKELNLALEHILTTLLEKEILYIDNKSLDVMLTVYNNKILKGSLFTKIFSKDKYENYKRGNSK
ncbi:hypothetical protein L5F42_05855 [Aliarcobacter butzleri]|uniref:hypothetical protein n=1 Tax=Aliarcobacter butzleri TaxID=28197 RepID=UPI001EDD6FC5|nr:hypothetical protein [Aliarcobacter butzleri]MCG3699365.1 hypothetical protein [Aliarcobacter butzleri]